MNKTGSPSFLEKLLHRTGGRYILLTLLVMQLVNTSMLILLTALPAQDNAGFSISQATGLLIFGGIALLFRNVLLLVQIYRLNRDLISRLSKLGQPEAVNTDPKQEKRAWMQANSVSKRYIFLEFVELILFVQAPTLAFGYFGLHLSISQTVYLGLAALAAGLVNFIIGSLTLDQWLKPVIQALLPKEFETQLVGMKGMRLWAKLSFAILGLVMIGLLLTVPTAYRQVNLIFADITRSPQLETTALWAIVNAGVGAIVVGVFISFWLVPYFSTPFRKMIALFREVETGDLSQRIEVSSSDEFGELNIYLNHMIDRLQVMTSTLEEQVVERTGQLGQANQQLQVELIERKRMEEQLAYTAVHDPLTNLPNRVLLMDRLTHVMERARRHKNYAFAVIFIDLDRFKVVNDSLGHNIGDLLLIESARRLEACVRSEDTVARLGGDEFVLLLEELVDATGCIRVADRILHELALPAELGGYKTFISISMGIVLGEARYERPEDILRDADIAMYHAKKQGRGRYEVFDPAMLQGVMTRIELETDLRKALGKQEFIVHYQPIIDLKANRIVGFEALVRWQHPTRGLTPPGEFIPIAEEMGLIVPIGYWVLDEACRQIHAWQVQYAAEPPLTMNVNLSTRQCAEMDLVDRIVETLQKYQLDASSLKLELTESLIVEDSAYISTILTRLRDLGIQVQIDDFGTGYSSLGYLHTLPIDTLKIDRTFINRLGIKGSGSEIVQTILALAHGLGMKVIAEGVETDDQLSRLKAMSCEYVQGFLISKPVESQQAGDLLEKSFAALRASESSNTPAPKA
ncbi:MAG: EAL domain-containing protein [Anaerolineaceae bacterium]|nr:EAL domain-containing protein [Anaerolineaceae bacterium]